jgi:L-threonylcarbamoyladenylate synthase
MFFSLGSALAALGDIPPRTREATTSLLPGPVTLVLPNPRRLYPLACGPERERIGVRVPALGGALAPMCTAAVAVLQSSANPSGGRDPRRLEDVEPRLLEGVDVALDGGELPGTPSTVVDLTRYEDGGAYEVLREGAVPPSRLAELL